MVQNVSSEELFTGKIWMTAWSMTGPWKMPFWTSATSCRPSWSLQKTMPSRMPLTKWPWIASMDQPSVVSLPTLLLSDSGSRMSWVFLNFFFLCHLGSTYFGKVYLGNSCDSDHHRNIRHLCNNDIFIVFALGTLGERTLIAFVQIMSCHPVNPRKVLSHVFCLKTSQYKWANKFFWAFLKILWVN